ncbi:hypothetical protein ACOJUR_10010 [Alicyclobacillus tolerans]|uniref:Uncharacterized protein n=2 Tax=Alicyclobacillus tolerans TaxID=90970 RepID=A0ABT9LWQ4_9BACL|nr:MULTISPECIES: hypothetical protein [Alicyclobacillus]MDP9728682.1 hypothetical protein [Alicyclobacillus tengchongensis]SHK41900.1 hypothetical protein SAMN05443507_11384 [Alicyclobacillus montanus]
MISMLMFLPRLFRYFGMFQSFMGFVRPLFPQMKRILRPSSAAA